MPKLNTPKKPAITSWHPAYIIYQLRLKGMSLHRLSRQNGYARDSLQLALRQPWPKAEKIIAEFLGVSPQEIWPSRYDERGESNRRRGGYHPSRNFSTGSQRSVIQRQRVA